MVVVALYLPQTLMQSVAGYESAGLPANLRVVSNFFRTAPDGSVRAFTAPVVTDRNKHAGTASLVMGMPLPPRRHALVLGSHEQDLRLTEGAEVEVQLSIGHLELTEDLLRALPVALQSFDAVVIGDASMLFTKSVLDDLLVSSRA